MENSAAHAQFLKMTETPVRRLILSLAAPTICSMLITTFYNMADTFFVAKLGTSATAAVGIVFSLMAIIQAIGFMFGQGAASIASRKLGEEKNDEASRATSTAFFAAFFCGLLLTAVGLANLDGFMRALGATETILPFAKDYAKYILIGAPVMTTSFVMNTNLRAEGKAFFAMTGIVTGGILNVFLDPLLIFVFNMGIAGAAIATLFSQCVSFCILLSHFVFKRSVLTISITKVSRRPSYYMNIVNTGLPTLLRQGLASVASIALNTTAALYGDAAVAAMTIVMRVTMFIGSILIGFGQGFQPVAGYNYGAKRYDRLMEAYWFCVRTGTVVLGLLGAFLFVNAASVIGIFQNSDAMVTVIGTFAFRAQCVTMPLQAIIVITNMMFQSTGKVKQGSFLAAARQGLFFLPAIYVLPPILGLRGVQISQSVADAMSALCAVPLLIPFMNWMKDKMKEPPVQLNDETLSQLKLPENDLD